MRLPSSGRGWLFFLLVATVLVSGCARGPRVLPEADRTPIDRSLVEYPSEYTLQRFATGLTAPSAFTFDDDGAMLIGENGSGGREPRVYGFRRDGSQFEIYPFGRRLPFGIGGDKFRLYGPIGGMVAHGGKIYVSHRDKSDLGVITAFDYDGKHETVVAGLPAQGDHGVTDLAIHPDNGRLYFGVGSATNSGVVGLDNWIWVKRHPKVADQYWSDKAEIFLRGRRFDTANPRAGFFTGGELAVTAPFQWFGSSNQTRIHRARDGKPNAAIYSVTPGGGVGSELRVEAFGVRMPAGLAFNEFGRLYFTNRGMELRGTRPVKDDPDALLRLVPETWYGWPDYTADLRPVTDEMFQPPQWMIARSGYPDLDFVIDHAASDLQPPTPADRDTLVQSAFPALSGASKLDFVPGSGPAGEAFNEFRGDAIVALSGDRAPFATSGQPLIGPVGYKVMRVDVDTRQARDFIRNTGGLPASKQRGDARKNPDLLERPVDVKFGPEGAMYVLDYGRLEVRGGRERTPRGTGQIFRLVPATPPATQPAADAEEGEDGDAGD